MRLNKFTVSAAMLLAVTPSAALPQNNDAEDGATESEGNLNEIIVTATKRQESLQDVGVSVTAVGSEALERINPSDSTEIFQSVPNLELRANAGSTNANIFLRGVGSTGISFNLQSGVGVYSDEVVLNSPVVNISQVFDLERVEVLRGPQNTLYGRNTTGGAINFISRGPEIGGDVNGFVQGTYGRFDQIDVTGALGLPVGESAAIRVAGQVQSRDGIRQNLITGNDDVEREKWGLRGQFAVESGFFSANLKGHIERVRGSNLRYKSIGGFEPSDLTTPCSQPNTLGACAASDGFQDSASPREVSNDLVDARNDVNSGGASLTMDFDFDTISIRSITAYEENSQILSEDSDGSPAPAFHFFLDNEQDQFSQEVRVSSTADQPFRWILGGYYFTENLRGQTGPLFATPMGTMLVQSLAEFDNRTYSAYGEAEYDLSDNLTVKAGLRYSSDRIEGTGAALLAFESFLPGVDLNNSLFGGQSSPCIRRIIGIGFCQWCWNLHRRRSWRWRKPHYRVRWSRRSKRKHQWHNIQQLRLDAWCRPASERRRACVCQMEPRL